MKELPGVPRGFSQPLAHASWHPKHQHSQRRMSSAQPEQRVPGRMGRASDASCLALPCGLLLLICEPLPTLSRLRLALGCHARQVVQQSLFNPISELKTAALPPSEVSGWRSLVPQLAVSPQTESDTSDPCFPHKEMGPREKGPT